MNSQSSMLVTLSSMCTNSPAPVLLMKYELNKCNVPDTPTMITDPPTEFLTNLESVTVTVGDSIASIINPAKYFALLFIS